MRLAALVALAATLPGVAASGPHIEVQLTQGGGPLGLNEQMPLTFAFTFTCGEPPDPATHIDIEPPAGNRFNVTLERQHWVYTQADCVQAEGTIRDESHGTFRFTAKMPPFLELQLPFPAFVGNGRDVWTDAQATLRVVPDAVLQIGAVLGVPTEASRSGGRLHESAPWTVTNIGSGPFVAQIRVESKPSWLDVDVPAEVSSGPGGIEGANATFTMRASMPVSCPAPSAVVTLAFQVRSPDPRSRAHAETKVQGVLPCQPGLASTPLPLALAAVALVAASALARRRVRMHKR